MDPCFLLCVERGRLESQSLLCVESLREWGGAFSEAPVYAFSPRPEHLPGDDTIAALERLGTRSVAEPLNPEHGELPHTNKVHCCAWAERELDHELLVFVDSDTVFLNEPAELAGDGWVAAVRPVGEANAASSTGADDRNDNAWEHLYDRLAVAARPFVGAAVTGERLRAFFNAGLVATRREAGVMGAWKEALARLFDSQPLRRRRFRGQLDQLALAGTLAGRFEDVHLLGDAYNYPLPKRIRLPARMQALGIDDLVHVHGHRWLHLPGFLTLVRPRLDASRARYRWLDERLPLEPTIDEPFRFPPPD
jgi:hypothetical protein